MTRTRPFPRFLARGSGPPVICALFLFSARADIIDRIAVSVGNRVITASEIERQIRVSAFLNGTSLDLSPAARRATAEKLVEQRLIQRELDTSRYPLPDAGEIDPILDVFKSRQFPNGEDYRHALADYGITEQDVKDQLLWARRLMRFIGIRFRPAIRVSAQDVQKYFAGTVAPAARAANPTEPLLDDYYSQIEEKLTGERADEEMNLWLAESRRRTEIIYHDEVFR